MYSYFYVHSSIKHLSGHFGATFMSSLVLLRYLYNASVKIFCTRSQSSVNSSYKVNRAEELRTDACALNRITDLFCKSAKLTRGRLEKSVKDV